MQNIIYVQINTNKNEPFETPSMRRHLYGFLHYVHRTLEFAYIKSNCYVINEHKHIYLHTLFM